MISKTRRPEIEEICRIWREKADPERIILFGSAARGDESRDSDLDFLVVWRGDSFPNNRRRAGYLMRVIPESILTPMDVLVLQPEEYEEAISDPETFTSQIVREGDTLYERVAC